MGTSTTRVTSEAEGGRRAVYNAMGGRRRRRRTSQGCRWDGAAAGGVERQGLARSRRLCGRGSTDGRREWRKIGANRPQGRWLCRARVVVGGGSAMDRPVSVVGRLHRLCGAVLVGSATPAGFRLPSGASCQSPLPRSCLKHPLLVRPCAAHDDVGMCNVPPSCSVNDCTGCGRQHFASSPSMLSSFVQFTRARYKPRRTFSSCTPVVPRPG